MVQVGSEISEDSIESDDCEFSNDLNLPAGFCFEDIEDPVPETYDSYYGRRSEAFYASFATRNNIPYFTREAMQHKAFVASAVNPHPTMNFVFDDEDDLPKYKPVCLSQSAPIPSREIQKRAADAYDNIMRPLSKFAYETDDDVLDAPEEMVAAMQNLMSASFEPFPAIDCQDEAKQSTTGPAICALNHNLFNQVVGMQPVDDFCALIFGAFNGVTDMIRVAKAHYYNRAGGRYHVDSYDPYIPIHPDARRIKKGKKTPSFDVPGKDYHKETHPNFADQKYHLVLGISTAQYLYDRIGNTRPAMEKVLKSIRPGGVFVGSYYDARQMSTIRGPIWKAPNFYHPSQNIRLMEVTKDNMGNPSQIVHSFGTVYTEPFVEAFLFEYEAYKKGGDCMIYSCQDSRIFTPFEYKSNPHLNPDIPEAKAANIVVMTKPQFPFARSWDFTSRKSTTMPPLKWEGTVPRSPVFTFLIAGKPIVGGDAIDLINGGFFLVAGKTDGFPVNCRLLDKTLTLYSHKGILNFPVLDPNDYSFQCECVKNRLVFIQMTYVSDEPLTFGYGMTFAYALRDDPMSVFSLFDYKSWGPNMDKLPKEETLEGYVVVNYISPPPPKVQSGVKSFTPLATYYTGQYYCKHRPTVDLDVRNFWRSGAESFSKYYVRTSQGMLRFEWHDINAPVRNCIVEFYLDGGVRRVRKDKDKGNDDSKVADAVNSLAPDRLRTMLRTNYRKYNFKRESDSMCSSLGAKDITTFDAYDLFMLAVSYPRGLKIIENDQMRRDIAEYRCKLYRNPHLSTLYDSAVAMQDFKHKFSQGKNRA